MKKILIKRPFIPLCRAICVLVLLTGMNACRKVEYRTVANPTYLRVFNSLTYRTSLFSAEPVPFLCMLIDPQTDAKGDFTGAAIVGDFLDKRNTYASPNPAHVGLSTSRFNPEYPGKELVPTAPILNGFDLTNWAQVPSGRHRIVFMSRPSNDIPFFQLDEPLKHTKLIDTILDLQEKEVYTIQVLQHDFHTKKIGLHVRQETFHKQPLADSLVYVNFYNLSAKGYWNAENGLKTLEADDINVPLRYGIRDTMNIYLSHLTAKNVPIPGYMYQLAGTIQRNTEIPTVTPYHAFPVFVDTAETGMATTSWQFIQFFAPGINPVLSTVYGAPPSIFLPVHSSVVNGRYGYAQFDTRHIQEPVQDVLPNMIVNVHAGKYNPRSFGVVNTIEVINGNIFLTTIQRKYDAPIY